MSFWIWYDRLLHIRCPHFLNDQVSVVGILPIGSKNNSFRVILTVQNFTTMTSAGGTATTRSIVPRLVRLLSTAHAAKKERAVTDFAWSKAFSTQYFPKTLATSCMFSFGIGFYGMNSWQQNRQLEWRRWQEEAESQFYKMHVAKNDTKPSRNFPVNKSLI